VATVEERIQVIEDLTETLSRDVECTCPTWDSLRTRKHERHCPCFALLSDIVKRFKKRMPRKPRNKTTKRCESRKAYPDRRALERLYCRLDAGHSGQHRDGSFAWDGDDRCTQHSVHKTSMRRCRLLAGHQEAHWDGYTVWPTTEGGT
jgi:hypothetical protein